MNKKILILLVLFLMTGCWNYQELNSLAITTAMSIDKKGDEYEVGILIANSKKNQVSSKEGESQTVVYSGKGKSLSDALKTIDLKNPRQTYIGHLSVIVISEDVAKEGLSDVLDLLLRNSESTKRFFLAITKDDKSKDIIKIISPLETFPSQTISTNIRNSSESQAISTAITYSKFVENILKKGMNPVLPTIKVEGNSKKGESTKNLDNSSLKAVLKLDTLALFKSDKLIGYASEDESRGINLALGKINKMIVEYKCEENLLVANLSEMKTKTNVVLKDGKPKGVIKVSGIGYIAENNCKLDLTKTKTINKIEKNVNKKTKKLIKKGINKIKEENTDVIGFGNITYKKYPKYYKKINWDKEFKNLDIEIKTDIKMTTKGSASQSIKEAIDED